MNRQVMLRATPGTTLDAGAPLVVNPVNRREYIPATDRHEGHDAELRMTVKVGASGVMSVPATIPQPKADSRPIKRGTLVEAPSIKPDDGE